MKKSFYLFIFIIFPGILFGYKTGDVLLSVYGSSGATYSFNLTPGDNMSEVIYKNQGAFEDGEAGLEWAYGVHLEFSYFFNPSTSFVLGISYQMKRIFIEHKKKIDNIALGSPFPPVSIPVNDLSITLKAEFIYSYLIVRNYFSDYFFMGVGFYYGFAIDEFDAKFEIGSNTNEGDIPEEATNDDIGFIFELGSTVPFSKAIGLNIIGRLEWGLKGAVTEGDDRNYKFDTTISSFSFLVGLNFNF